MKSSLLLVLAQLSCVAFAAVPDLDGTTAFSTETFEKWRLLLHKDKELAFDYSDRIKHMKSKYPKLYQDCPKTLQEADIRLSRVEAKYIVPQSALDETDTRLSPAPLATSPALLNWVSLTYYVNDGNCGVIYTQLDPGRSQDGLPGWDDPHYDDYRYFLERGMVTKAIKDSEILLSPEEAFIEGVYEKKILQDGFKELVLQKFEENGGYDLRYKFIGLKDGSAITVSAKEGKVREVKSWE